MILGLWFSTRSKTIPPTPPLLLFKPSVFLTLFQTRGPFTKKEHKYRRRLFSKSSYSVELFIIFTLLILCTLFLLFHIGVYSFCKFMLGTLQKNLRIKPKDFCITGNSKKSLQWFNDNKHFITWFLLRTLLLYYLLMSIAVSICWGCLNRKFIKTKDIYCYNSDPGRS